MTTPRAYDGPMEALSRLPGRVRYRVPVLIGQSALAGAVTIDLEAHPFIEQINANPVTGGVLMRHGSEDEAEPERWLREALGRQLVASLSVPEHLDRPVHRAESPLAVADRDHPLMRLLAMTDRHRALRTQAVSLTLLNGLDEAVSPVLVGLAADTATRGSLSLLGRLGFATLSSRVLALAGISGGLWLLSSAIDYFKQRSLSRLANVVRHDLRMQLYNHVQSLDLADVEARDTTDWLAVLDKDVNQIHQFIRQGIEPFFQMGTNLLIVGAAFVIVSPAMAAAQLLMLPPLAWASVKLLRPIRAKHLLARHDSDRMNALLAGNVAGMSTIASFNAQGDEAARVDHASAKYLQSASEAEKIEAIYVPTLRAVSGAGFVTTLIWGSAQAALGRVSIGVVDSVALMQLRLMDSLGRMGIGLDQYQKTANALERIYRTLDTAPTIISGPARLPRAAVQGDVVFDNVVFGYDPQRPVLNGVSMHCPAGRTVGIVGASGAGKSTLLKLLMRFWDTQSGGVRVDGVDVRELNVEDLRHSIALVSQQITLFAGSIRDNIAYGNRDATLHDVIAAARVAEAHDFIMALPGGYDSMLGFGGLTLSGGQRQRLAIARAVLSNRPLLLFDEATSSLDHTTEAALQRSLEVATRGRTTLIVAHRLSMVRHADVIYAMDNGVICEQGRHDELLEAGGIYATMWRVQTGERYAPPPPSWSAPT
jgi:ATP-binding cassette, subfamily B, bacterial